LARSAGRGAATIRAPILESFPFYRDSPFTVRERMDACVQHAMLPAGSYFYREWDVCPHFAIVVAGDIRVYKRGGMGREVTLYHVCDGEPCLVNLLCVMLNQPAMANAQVECDTSAITFPAAPIREWMGDSVALRNYVFEALSARMVNVMTLVEEIAFQRMDSRLATLLLKRFGQEVTLLATHEEIAAELGTAREVVSRLLREFARRGAIDMSRGHVELRDPDILRQIM